MIWRNVLIEIEGVKQPVLPATLLSHHPAALHQCTARSDPLHKRRFSTQRSFSTELVGSGPSQEHATSRWHSPLLFISGLLGVAVAINSAAAVLWTTLSCDAATSACETMRGPFTVVQG